MQASCLIAIVSDRRQQTKGKTLMKLIAIALAMLALFANSARAQRLYTCDGGKVCLCQGVQAQTPSGELYCNGVLGCTTRACTAAERRLGWWNERRIIEGGQKWPDLRSGDTLTGTLPKDVRTSRPGDIVLVENRTGRRISQAKLDLDGGFSFHVGAPTRGGCIDFSIEIQKQRLSACEIGPLALVTAVTTNQRANSGKGRE